MAPKQKGPAPRDRTCGNCLHFKPEADEPAVGECRMNPPSVLYDAEDGAFSMWPVVSAADDYCGQHRGSQ
ncbi:MAG: hypothetical protein ACK5X3_08640 [Pseudomonadota bacterium]